MVFVGCECCGSLPLYVIYSVLRYERLLSGCKELAMIFSNNKRNLLLFFQVYSEGFNYAASYVYVARFAQVILDSDIYIVLIHKSSKNDRYNRNL